MARELDEDLRAALAEVALARERPYYDAEADQSAAEAYYAKVDRDRLGDLDRLADLVSSTHTTKPRYKPARELYPWVDLQPDGKLRSLYTSEIFEPEDLIHADFEILRTRVAQLMRATVRDDSDRAMVEAQVEAQLPFNCEHVVPQSWFAKSEPMRGDLHHLFACESRCNGFRGNTPFAEYPDFPQPPPPDDIGGVGALEAIRGDCGKSEPGAFEPANGKGAAARAVFYFRLRYPGEISGGDMPDDRWAVVLAWHEQEPVTTWERHRNAAIFERQGNRNPFIDHPEWLPDVVVSQRR